MQVLFYQYSWESIWTEKYVIQRKSWYHQIPARTISLEGPPPPLTPTATYLKL